MSALLHHCTFALTVPDSDLRPCPLLDPASPKDNISIVNNHRLARRHTVLRFKKSDGDRPINMDCDKGWGRCVPVADLDLGLKLAAWRFTVGPGYPGGCEPGKGGLITGPHYHRVADGLYPHHVQRLRGGDPQPLPLPHSVEAGSFVPADDLPIHIDDLTWTW